jgi:hypothetical protein
MTEIFNFYDYLSKVMALLCHKALTLMPRKCDAPPYSRRVTLFGDVPLNAQMDFPGFARHQIALKCNSMRGVYERQTVYR